MPQLNDQSSSSNIVLDEHVLMFSRLSTLHLNMAFHRPTFGQTLFALEATEHSE